MIKKSAGFSLVELIIAMAIFAVAIGLISTSFVGLVRTQRTATSDRATLDNGRRIIEDMVRDVRGASSIEVCQIPETAGQSLFIGADTPVVYYATGGRFYRQDEWGNEVPGGCPEGVDTDSSKESTPPGVSGSLTAKANADNTAVELNLTVRAGNSSTTLTTMGAVRGVSGE